MVRSRAHAIAIATAALVCSGGVRADFPSADVRSFRPPTDPGGSLYLEPAATPGNGAFNTGGFLSYGWRPAVVRDESGQIVTTLVRHQLALDLLANIGLTSRGSFGMDLPLVLYQAGSHGSIARAVSGAEPPPAQALGDLALVLKGNFVAEKPLGGLGLSGLFTLTLPTGGAASYMGEAMPTTELRMLGEYRLIAIALQATAGYAVRFAERDVLTRTYGDAIPWGVGLSVKPQAFGWDEQGRFTWVAEIHGAAFLPPSPSAKDRGQLRPASPVVAGLSARYALGKDVSGLLGVQSSLTEALGGAPLQLIASVAWAPRTHDADNDGVPDDIDQCPELPEDHDGFEDEDGCPDWDNDNDGIADVMDKCPNEPEDLDGFQDEDGCPDWDNDQDGIPDKDDACPNVAGPRRDDPKTSGCPDRDGDGIIDKLDACPGEPGPRSKDPKKNGCPVLDRDGDGILDKDDACPDKPGPRSGDPRMNGCAPSDRDGDGIDDVLDKCPDEPETYNGIDDDDGCPDAGGNPLALIEENKRGASLLLGRPIAWKGGGEASEIDPASLPVLRAVALEMFRHKDWSLAVGVRPADASAGAQQAAFARAIAVVNALSAITRRDGAFETVGWKAVEKEPGAAKTGLGLRVLLPAKAGANPR